MGFMDFWNFAIAGAILIAPMVAGILVFRADSRMIPRISYVLFGLLAAISAITIWKFDESIRLSFLWPVTSEPSGYFNFSLKLHWGNFLWFLFSCGSLVSHLIYNEDQEHDVVTKRKSTLFLYGVTVSSALAFLSENFFLSLLFAEISFFLVFSLLLFSKDEDGNAERSSYFKRAVFLFLSLISLLGLALVGKVHTMTILLIGSLLYFASTIFSRHTLSNWGSLFLNLHLYALLFFLNGRVVNEEFASELLFYFSILFACLAILFSIFSTLVTKKIDAVSWFLLAVVCFFVFSRLSTSKPDEFIWLSYEAVGLAAVLAISVQLFFAEKFSTPALKALQIASLGLLLSFITGAIPAIDQSVIKAKAEFSARMIFLAFISFLLAVAVGKMVSIGSHAVNNKKPSVPGGLVAAILPFVMVFVLFVTVSIHLTHLFGEGPFHQGIIYVLSSPHVMIESAVIVLGLALGYFLGVRSGLANWKYGNKIQMEIFFPALDPSLIGGTERIPAIAGNVYLSTRNATEAVSKRLVSIFAVADRWVFGERVYSGLIRQSLKISGYVKTVHTGDSRAYLFWGVLVVLLSSILFVWEGR